MSLKRAEALLAKIGATIEDNSTRDQYDFTIDSTEGKQFVLNGASCVCIVIDRTFKDISKSEAWKIVLQECKSIVNDGYL